MVQRPTVCILEPYQVCLHPAVRSGRLVVPILSSPLQVDLGRILAACGSAGVLLGQIIGLSVFSCHLRVTETFVENAGLCSCSKRWC